MRYVVMLVAVAVAANACEPRSTSVGPEGIVPNTIRLYTSIPDRVATDWSGPDSLLYGRVFGSVIIRSP